MKRRKSIFDYGRRYHKGKLVGWEVWKVKAQDESETNAVATFYGKKARTHAQAFTRELNTEKVG